MRSRRARSVLADAPLPLRRILVAAETECPPGHAPALAAFTALAFRQVPARGLFDPGIRDEPDLFAAIEAVAVKHLELGKARTGFRQALKEARLPFEQADEVEQAAQQVQAVTDTAYFYAGLAFGLVFTLGYRGA